MAGAGTNQRLKYCPFLVLLPKAILINGMHELKRCLLFGGVVEFP